MHEVDLSTEADAVLDVAHFVGFRLGQGHMAEICGNQEDLMSVC